MEILSNPHFTQVAIPLVAVGASIFLKFVSRNDSHAGFKKEDLAVGLDLSVTALLLFMTISSGLAIQVSASPENEALIAKVATVPWILAAFIVGIWAVSTIVRKLGWKKQDDLHGIWGIVVPDAFGLFTLLFVVNWIA